MITMFRSHGYRYYRLAFVNQNLSREYSPWINVIDSELSAHPNQYFDVFPNPADHQGITIFSRLSGMLAGDLSLIDNTGKLVYRQNRFFDRRISVPTSRLKPGVYALLIQLPDGRVERHKITIQP